MHPQKVKQSLPEVKKQGDFGRKIYAKLVKTFPALGDRLPQGGKRRSKQSPH